MTNTNNGVEITITEDSHTDHGLTGAQMDFVLNAVRSGEGASFAVKVPGFAIAQVQLPAELGALDCALIGPETGQNAPKASQVFYGVRGTGREWLSRLTDLAPTVSQTATVIVVGGNLATVYGGPLAPQEPGDKGLADSGHEASVEFWSRHALAVTGGPAVVRKEGASFAEFAKAAVKEETEAQA